MQPTTTYTVHGKKRGFLWEFKYYLNGALFGFKIVEGTLSATQMDWLFKGGNFPASETLMKTLWINNKKLATLLEVTIGEPDLTFEAFMKAYAYPVKKQMAERAWNKTSKSNKIKAFLGIKPYNGALHRKRTAKAMPSTYLNQQYYLDDWNAIH